jgi:membrane associated rhomboid family serine protease
LFYFSLIGTSHALLMTVLMFAGGMVTFLVVAACGGLMVRTLRLTDQPKAAAWTQVGVLGGGALSGALILWKGFQELRTHDRKGFAVA